jgi:hypothetical protein
MPYVVAVHDTMKTYGGMEVSAPHINLGTRLGKSSRYPLARRLGREENNQYRCRE